LAQWRGKGKVTRLPGGAGSSAGDARGRQGAERGWLTGGIQASVREGDAGRPLRACWAGRVRVRERGERLLRKAGRGGAARSRAGERAAWRGAGRGGWRLKLGFGAGASEGEAGLWRGPGLGCGRRAEVGLGPG